jgi:Raf kinase inhibitor-like YbhB/YbcL family protein
MLTIWIEPPLAQRGETTMGFALSNELTIASEAFADGGAIPVRHTAFGESVSPALSWSGVPDGAASFALFCHDPDAPMVAPDGTYGFVHWVLYNIPANVSQLPEGVSGLYTAGLNQMGNPGFIGPQPPPGHGRHHYFFWLLALRSAPELEDGLNLWSLLSRVEPELVAMNRLVGTVDGPT